MTCCSSPRCARWSDAAHEKGVETIAERVEDANTMAVLWQLGVQHVQGYLIQSPEEVVISGRDSAAAKVG